MKPPAPSSRSVGDLRNLTPARVGLGRAGASMPVKALLDFTLDHARARDAVHAAFDVSAVVSGLADLGLNAIDVTSRAPSRRDYLRRPDLGRMLDPASRDLLASHQDGPCQLAIVIGDGLSPTAVHAHAVRLVRSLIPCMAAEGIEIGHADEPPRVSPVESHGIGYGGSLWTKLPELAGPAARILPENVALCNESKRTDHHFIIHRQASEGARPGGRPCADHTSAGKHSKGTRVSRSRPDKLLPLFGEIV